MTETETKGTREDRRSAIQLRPIDTEQGLLNRADGSARYTQGKKIISLLFIVKVILHSLYYIFILCSSFYSQNYIFFAYETIQLTLLKANPQ